MELCFGVGASKNFPVVLQKFLIKDNFLKKNSILTKAKNPSHLFLMSSREKSPKRSKKLNDHIIFKIKFDYDINGFNHNEKCEVYFPPGSINQSRLEMMKEWASMEKDLAVYILSGKKDKAFLKEIFAGKFGRLDERSCTSFSGTIHLIKVCSRDSFKAIQKLLNAVC